MEDGGVSLYRTDNPIHTLDNMVVYLERMERNATLGKVNR